MTKILFLVVHAGMMAVKMHILIRLHACQPVRLEHYPDGRTNSSKYGSYNNYLIEVCHVRLNSLCFQSITKSFGREHINYFYNSYT